MAKNARDLLAGESFRVTCTCEDALDEAGDILLILREALVAFGASRHNWKVFGIGLIQEYTRRSMVAALDVAVATEHARCYFSFVCKRIYL